jgi:hypothetical protein
MQEKLLADFFAKRAAKHFGRHYDLLILVFEKYSKHTFCVWRTVWGLPKELGGGFAHPLADFYIK